MSSAAKLRKFGRGTATIATAALVMTSFGPAAFAWVAPGTGAVPGSAPTASNQAGAASIGLIDTDLAKADTQGALSVVPGATAQPIGDTRFVFPSTWREGDYIEFEVGAGSKANGAAATRITFTSQPNINVDTKPYAATTHVHDTSSNASVVTGSTEDHLEQPYIVKNGLTPVAPAFTVTPQSSTGDAYKDRVRITFTNDSKVDVSDAKFIGAINGAKVDLGDGLTGNVSMTMKTFSKAGTDVTTTQSPVIDDGGSQANVTYPASISLATLSVASAGVNADGSDQYVGPLTVQAASGKNLSGGDTVVTLAGQSANFVAQPVDYTLYDAQGNIKGSGQATPNATTKTITIPNPSNTAVTKIVISNVLVNASRATSLSYTLSSAGTWTTPGGYLPGHQEDIEVPKATTVAQATASALPDRLGGLDRYQTAVKIAERAAAEAGMAGPGTGESDNVVIASGESFPDALSSGYLAATKRAQLILTRHGSLPQTDIEFLKNYGAKNVYIVGGEGAVSSAVESQLRDLQSYDVQGVDKTETDSRTVNDGTFATTTASNGIVGDAVLSYRGLANAPAASFDVVATRDGSGNIGVDAVTTTLPGATIKNAAITGALNGGKATVSWQGQDIEFTIPAAAASSTTTGTFNRTNTTRTVSTTTTVVSDGASAPLSERRVVPLNAKLTVLRLAGSDRFETNRKVNEYAGATNVNPIGTTVPEYGKASKKTAILANGMTPWDALAAGPLVGNGFGNPIPVVLTAGSSLNSNARAQMQNLDIEASLMIGGTGVLPDSLMGEQDGLGVYSSRLGGADRWGTARAVAEYALRSNIGSSTNKAPGMAFGRHNPILANGGSMNGSYTANGAPMKWADALASGPFAAATNRVIALTDSRSLPGTTKDLLTANKAKFFTSVIAVGLGDVVSTETVKAANDAITS